MNNFLVALSIAIFGIFLQSERLLAVGGVNPNLLLVTLLLLVFLLSDRKSFLIFSMALLAIAVFWGYFWIERILLVFGFAFLAKIFKESLTGDPLFDFLFSIGVGTLVFHAVSGVFSPISFPGFLIVFFETIYNCFGGLVIWFVFSNAFFRVNQRWGGWHKVLKRL